MINCKPEISCMGFRGGPIVRISKPGGFGRERNTTTPDSGGQCLYRYSTTVVATESLMPDTNTFGLGSINQSFMRPRTAGGKSFASTTSTATCPQQITDIFSRFCQEVEFDYSGAKGGRDPMLVIASRQLSGELKSQVNAQFFFI